MERYYHLWLLLLMIWMVGIYSFRAVPSSIMLGKYVSPKGSRWRNQRHQSLQMRWGMKTETTNSITEDGKLLRDTVPFEIRGFSLPLVIFSVGILVTASSFVGYFSGSDGAVSSIGFVYGIPIFLIGLSLWYGEIPPVPVFSSPAGDQAWETYATDTLKKVKQDVTRHRYGDNAHLDSTLDTLGLRPPQKKYPKLISLKQEASNTGQLIFTMTFQSSETPYKTWIEPDRIKRYARFFGPNVLAKVIKVNAEERLVAIELTTCSSEEYEQYLQASDSPANPTDTSVQSREEPSTTINTNATST